MRQKLAGWGRPLRVARRLGKFGKRQTPRMIGAKAASPHLLIQLHQRGLAPDQACALPRVNRLTITLLCLIVRLNHFLLSIGEMIQAARNARNISVATTPSSR